MEFKSFKNWSITDLNLRRENNENSKKKSKKLPSEKNNREK